MNYNLVFEYDTHDKIPAELPEHLMTKKNVVEAINKVNDISDFVVYDEEILYAITILELNVYEPKEAHIWDQPVDVIADKAYDCIVASFVWGIRDIKEEDVSPVVIDTGSSS